MKGVSGTLCSGHYNCEEAIASSRTWTATPLIPERTYRCCRGRVQRWSRPFSDPPLTITTKSIPENTWSRVVPRNRRVSVSGGGRRNPTLRLRSHPNGPLRVGDILQRCSAGICTCLEAWHAAIDVIEP